MATWKEITVADRTIPTASMTATARTSLTRYRATRPVVLVMRKKVKGSSA